MEISPMANGNALVAGSIPARGILYGNTTEGTAMYPLDEITQGARYYMRIYPNMPRRYALHIAVGSMRDVERQAVRMGIDLRPTATEKVAVQASGKPW